MRDEGESGVALILVDAAGENVIVVAPGANARLTPATSTVGEADAVIVPARDPAGGGAGGGARAPFFCLNAAPARGPLAARARPAGRQPLRDEAVGEVGGLVALTLGAEGAVLLRDGEELARARPPAVKAVDGTAAGDAFCAALVVGLLEGASPARR